MDITLESLTGKPMGAELEPPFIALQMGRAVITAAADIHCCVRVRPNTLAKRLAVRTRLQGLCFVASELQPWISLLISVCFLVCKLGRTRVLFSSWAVGIK